VSVASLTPAVASVLGGLEQAQADMRFGYSAGGGGVLASALVWLAAGIVALQFGAQKGIGTLLIGGMLIHPVGMVIERLLGRPGTHQKGNPLARLAGASTVWLIASLPLAYAASRLHVEWFFPAMLLVIGSRYLTFETLYGLRIYIACGLALLVAGLALGAVMATPFVSALAGGVIEMGFALTIISGDRRTHHPVPSLR
jgi:hypothetical protein